MTVAGWSGVLARVAGRSTKVRGGQSKISGRERQGASSAARRAAASVVTTSRGRRADAAAMLF